LPVVIGVSCELNLWGIRVQFSAGVGVLLFPAVSYAKDAGILS
jgi:hypothetical protein